MQIVEEDENKLITHCDVCEQMHICDEGHSSPVSL